MDFADVVHKALAERERGGAGDGETGALVKAVGHDGGINGAKERRPSLSLLSVPGSDRPTSQGASPVARGQDGPSLPGTPRTAAPPTSPLQLPFLPANGRPNADADGSKHATNARSPSASRSPTRRQTAADEYLLPPLYGQQIPSSPTSSPPSNALGLDTPRPRQRTQATFNWFDDMREKEKRDVGEAESFRRTDSPARLDMSRSSSLSTSANKANDGPNGAFTTSPPLPSSGSKPRSAFYFPTSSGSPSSSKTRRRQPRPNGYGNSTFAHDAQSTASDHDWSDIDSAPAPSGLSRPKSSPSTTKDRSPGSPFGPRRSSTDERHQNSTDTTGAQSKGSSLASGAQASGGLRGAFTVSDLERGARILRGEEPDRPAHETPAGAAKEPLRHTSALKKPTQALSPLFKGSTKLLGGGRLKRARSAGEAEGPSSGVATPSEHAGGRSRDASDRGSGSATPARRRSMHDATGDDADWEDETRDQFDTLAGSRSHDPQSGRPSQSRRVSLWTGGGFFAPHHRASGSGSGTSTPRGAESEDEGATSSGPRSKVPVGAARRGSAWNVVKNRFGVVGGDKGRKKKEKQGASLTGHELVSELATGALPLVLVKMATMDRDDKGDKRIPILMNYLKLKITDSVYPFHDRHAVFRIELEYGDGAVKWVIYRELKDFVNLHAHYRVANLRQGIDKFPAFPKTSLPYLNWLKSEGRGQVGKAEFARMQREALEIYLLKLIRATMFGPGANRLCKFLEISAMSIKLATRGGEQGKQGYLRITSSGASRRKQPGFHPLSWKKRHEPKWFIVRDSYIVAVESPASTEVFEVIMVDSTFEIERPTRVYRKGLNLLHTNGTNDSLNDVDPELREGNVDLLAEVAHPQGHRGAGDPNDPSTTNTKNNKEKDALKNSSVHTFYLRSSERKLRLVAKTERQQDQFVASIEKMLAKTIWAGKNRFESFAPIRLNVAAQWLIDGRDYFWSLSRAISLAKEKIYIHDWWLSPELYLRRPVPNNEKWRLDKLLQRKAREGVQVFVIVYKEVSNDFTPVDSQYTKLRLRGLHPNIHHEKMCVIDETIGFMGGLDLCFGRWDSPGHVLVDDGPNPIRDGRAVHGLDTETAARHQIWPGKDYSNQRVLDFHALSKPFEDMYDRGKVPRQPCWNYLLRIKNHSVKMPFLLPAPDFTPEQLQNQRITGTCEVQICRSVGPWSMGISHIEHSIQNAYIKCIQLSDHFVYIENQFFISSTEVEGTVIENKIGDALVSRIVRAHSEGTPWRAIIVTPLVPGYPYPLDHSEAGSVRLIMECQYRTICRGEHSIFARLRREGIDPDEYITFFGLRSWGTLPNGALTTESTYIHAKGMIVDDRIAIIGSANINERSQRGDRDSELACIIRDTDMIDSTMGGKPYQVGRFAHTMRVRLMREHLGIDVDELEASEGREELEAHEADHLTSKEEQWDPDHEQSVGDDRGAKAGKTSRFIRSAAGATGEYVSGVSVGITEAASLGLQKTAGKVTTDMKLKVDKKENKPPESVDDDEETKADRIVQGSSGTEGFASTVVPTLEEKVMTEGRPSDGNKLEGSVHDLRQQAARERKEGPTLQSPAQERETQEEANGDAGGQRPPPRDALPSDEHPQRDRLGEKTTQHNTSADDTRKLDMEDASSPGEPEPLLPMNEDGADLEDKHDEREKEVKVHPPPPDLNADPPDVAKADQGYRSLDQDGKDGHSKSGLSESRENLHRTTSQSQGNEQAVNLNTITSSLRRNLRERGAYTVPLAAPKIDPYGFADPLVDSFYKDVWLAAAVRNTQVYRKVFRCIPDDLVQTWKQYREFQNWAERHNKAPKNVVPPGDEAPHSDPAGHSGQHGAGGGGSGGGAMGQGRDEPGPTMDQENRGSTMESIKSASIPGGSSGAETSRSREKLDEYGVSEEKGGIERSTEGKSTITRRARSSTVAASEDSSATAVEGGKKARGRSGTVLRNGGGGGAGGGGANGEKKKDASSASSPGGANAGSSESGARGESNEGHEHEEAFPKEEREQMEALLEEVTGQLVVFPTRFLEAESAGGNFLFSKDRIPSVPTLVLLLVPIR
ncbi:phospholipase D [Rhodotorula toruloides]|uniref:Phospholipase D1 n=1 Tax=Rhodotorula toruloides TaxID=5286 RepID=A0A511KES5_RHOTO|nr:phospholipase D [Rhodotorula toruloides]